MGTAKWILAAAFLLAVAACTPAQICENFYEGFRVRNQLQATPQQRAMTTGLPDYAQYEAFRKKWRDETTAPAGR